MKRLIGLLILASLTAACGGLAGEPEIVATIAPQPTPAPIQVDDPAELGAALFAARCASCHGEAGRGDGAVLAQAGAVAPDFTDPATAAEQTLQEWTNTIRYGRIENLMPPWDDALTDAEIDAVAEFTYTMWENEEILAALPADSDPATTNTVDTEEVVEVVGSVSGEITHGTANTTLTETLSLGLHVLDAERQQVSFFTYELTDGLSYRFDDVPIRNDYSYLVSVIYDDTAFASQSITGTPDTPAMTLPVTVYDATTDPSAISIDMMVMMLLPEGDMLVVQQFMSFTNSTDRIYRSDDLIDDFTRKSIQIPLPAGATLLNGDILGQRFVLENAGTTPVLYDTQGVAPNSNHVVEILYALPFSAANDLAIEFPYALEADLEILSPSDGLTVASESLTAQGVRQFDFGLFEAHTASEISAGDSLNLAITSLIAPIAPPSTASEGFDILDLAPLLLIAGMSLLTASVLFLLFGQRQAALSQEDLLAQINELDARYQAGEIDESSYQQQRQALKRQLAELIPTTTAS